MCKVMYHKRQKAKGKWQIFRRGFTPYENLKQITKYCLRLFTADFFNYAKKENFKFRTGFTLIELMLVVIIIGALVAMVMPRLTGRSEQARAAAAKADIEANIATGLKLYELDNGNFPSSEEGLGALLNSTGSNKNWNGPYLEKKPIDPWGNEYKYKSPGEHRGDYDLYSLGKDGVESEDDVRNWD